MKKEIEKPVSSDKPNVIEMPLGEFAQQIGASKIEAVPPEQMRARLDALLAGREVPANEFVAYLISQAKAGTEEYRLIQQNIQELNGRLTQLQRRAIQLQGEQNRSLQDIIAWMDKRPGE